MSSDRLTFLDGLRGLAALSVVLLHWFDGHQSDLFGTSILAVDFFFLLSGFVIQLAYKDRISGLSDLPHFATRRLIRLYPLIGLGVVVGVARFGALRFIGDEHTPLDPLGVVAHLLLVPVDQSSATNMFPLNSPLWSLHFELVLYALFGIVLVRLRARSIAVLTATSSLGLGIWVLSRFGTSPASVDIGFYWLGLARALFSFSLGVLLAQCYARDQLSAITDRLAIPPGFLILPLGIFALPQHHVPAVVSFIYIVVIFPFILLAATTVSLEPPGTRVAALFGDLSYPVYVLHVPLMWTLSAGLKGIGVFDRPLLNGLIVLPIVIAASQVALKLIDEPVRARLNSAYRVRRGRPLRA